MSRNDLPNEKAPNFNARLRETLMTYLGKSGDPLDRGITLRDLVDSGLASIANLNAAKTGNSLPLTPGSAIGQAAGSTTYEPDLTPPPTPTGFTATPAITTILLQHDTPIYSQGHGHLRTHVYGAIRSSQNDPAPVFADAAEITQFSGTVASYATNPSTTWHLWIKWETFDGVLSTNPAGGTNGVEVTTGQDVALLLEALTGQLTEDQLYSDLGARIDLVDGPASLTGSVANRLTAYTPTATLTQNYYTKVDTDAAIVSATTSLVSTSDLATALGDYTTTASLTANYYTKTGADAAISSATSSLVSTSTLSTALGDYTTTAALQANYYTKASGQTLEGRYTVKVDLNGYVSGFGLASTANNATATSTFSIRSDSFYIASPSGPGISPAMPFIVRTTATTIGGVAVPAGVYMTDAFIQNGTITNAKIANLAVDDAKIDNLSATKITAGYLDAARIQAGSLDAKIANIDAAKITSGTIDSARIGDATITSAKIGDDIQSTSFLNNQFTALGSVWGYPTTTSWTSVFGTAISPGTAGAPGSYSSVKLTLAATKYTGTIMLSTTIPVVPGQRLEVGVSVQYLSPGEGGNSVEMAVVYSRLSNGNLSQLGSTSTAATVASHSGGTPVNTNEANFADLRGFVTVPSTYTSGSSSLVPQAAWIILRFSGSPGDAIYVAKPLLSKDVPASQTTPSPSYGYGFLGWRINKSGQAVFNDAVIRSDISVGASPAIVNGGMLGVGAVINKDGTFAMGSATNNILFDGTAMTMNTPFIQNPKTISNSATVAANANAQSIGPITVASGAYVDVPTGSVWSVT